MILMDTEAVVLYAEVMDECNSCCSVLGWKCLHQKPHIHTVLFVLSDLF